MSEKKAEDPLASIPDMPLEAELHELPADSVPEKRGARGPAGGPPSGPPAKRELDRAPLELRKAALVLLAGSIFPWGDPDNVRLFGGYVEKIICYLAVWIFYQSHVLKYVQTHGGKANGLVTALGKANVKVPMIVAAVVALVGVLPVVTYGAAEGMKLFTLSTEKAFLLLGGYVFVQIYDYEHGGKFNPLFALMFLFPAVGGLMAIIGRIIPNLAGPAFVSLIGAAIVTLAGGIAVHTMVVAMKEAKAHGIQKRAAMQEQRNAARAARKRADGGDPPAGAVPKGR